MVDKTCEVLKNSMKRVFGEDQRRINHALKVLTYVEEILLHETGDPLTVRAAAVLHDIGIVEAERRHGSSDWKYQEKYGPPVARKIMEDQKIDKNVINHVIRIIANHHSARDINTPEFRIVWDADWLANIPVDFKDLAENQLKLKKAIEKIFKTKTGKKKAYELFIENEN